MLFDLHVHTKEGSPCAHAPARTLVNRYKEKGFDGIVITDHVSRWYMENCHKLSYEDYCKFNYEVYLEAKDEGDKIGLTVLHGCEYKLDSTFNNDYLVYGVTYEFLTENLDLFKVSLQQFKEHCEKHNVVLYQAHPFRDYAAVMSPNYLHGYEVVNGTHIAHHSFRNEIASIWADKNKLHKIAGSDCHMEESVGLAGVKFKTEIKDNNDLVKALKEDNYYIVSSLPHTV